MASRKHISNKNNITFAIFVPHFKLGRLNRFALSPLTFLLRNFTSLNCFYSV